LSTEPLTYYATGRRKTSTARVHLRPGKGEMRLNDRNLDDYFGGHETLKLVVKQPFAVTETGDKFDVIARIDGGGVASQANALRHGISRALCVFNLEPLPVQQALVLFTRPPRSLRAPRGAVKPRGPVATGPAAAF
jgi:small subunit ribosomal protein S9